MAHQRVLLALLGLSGCYAYRPAGVTPAPGTRVRIVLTAASGITVLDSTAAAPRTVHDGVFEASGVIEAATRDTIALRLGELSTATGAAAGAARGVALIPVDRVARVSERRFQAGRTALGGIGFLTLAGGAFLIFLIITLTNTAD